MDYDYTGLATKFNVKCADGKTILKDAFKECDGKTVPVMWNHCHNDPTNVLGHALLKCSNEGVRSYIKFNDTPSGKNAKTLVDNGDITALSIFANQLKQQGNNVVHGIIREVSLVLAGANPEAYIDAYIKHGLPSEEESDDEAIIYGDEAPSLYHSEDKSTEKEDDSDKKEDKKVADENKKDTEETVEEVFNTLTEKQKTVVYALIGQALEDGETKDNDEDGDEKNMKHNLFDNDEGYAARDNSAKISHSDQEAIVALAKQTGVGSFKAALEVFADQNDIDSDSLAHSFDSIETLFPDFKNIKSGAPELITRDLGWVDTVINKATKTPFSRIRTRQIDARQEGIRAKGYKKGNQKGNIGNSKIINRTTDPQTIYVKDVLNRDDIIDITDFDVVTYQYGIMRNTLKEELALATMVGDDRDDDVADKIKEEHIRPIWTDSETYTIHTDVDLAAAKTKLNGTNTGANFGAEYIYAEAIITAALYSREKYKGTGKPDFYCTPHAVNQMLLARDLNGRRIYDSVSDLEKALNVANIYTVEQFEGLTRTDSDNNTKKLLGIFVNMSDYTYGSTKGGEITSFNQFDIDFNQNKYLIETRLSGALTRIASAIALEETVTDDDDESLGG